VKISDLHIERFGGWSGLHLTSLTDGLNVSYSQQGLDTTGIVQFVRSMLYGFDELYRRSLAPIPGASWGGSLGVRVGHARETIRWHDDGTVYGRFNVEQRDGSATMGHPRHLLRDVPLTTYDHAFAFGFQNRPSIEGLLVSAVQRDTSVHDAELSQRISHLRDSLNRQRDRLTQIPVVETPLATLKLRRDQLKSDIDSLHKSFERDRSSWRLREEELDRKIDTSRKRLGELRIRLQDVEYAIESRMVARREAAKRALVEKQETLAELDGQLSRWNSVLLEMQQQRDRLLSDVNSQEAQDVGFGATAREPRQHLGNLEAKIRDVQKLVDSLSRHETFHDEAWRNLRNAVIPSLSSMRDDVYGLCRALGREHTSIHRDECAQHLNQLTRCQSELRTTIENMTQRRKSLLAELSQLNRQLSSVDNGYESWRRFVDVDGNLWSENDPHSYERSVVDVALHGILCQRSECEHDINKVTAELVDLEKQRGCLPNWRSTELQHQRLSEKQLESDRTVQQIRDSRERIEVTSRIATLEAELRSSELAGQQESVFNVASDYLRRLTRGDWQGVEQRARDSLAVLNSDGVWTDYHLLNESTHDQVYLSVALAVISETARKGTQLPVILSDLCLRCSNDWTEATVDVLHQFAANGHQVVVFTGQASVAGLFNARNIAVNELPNSSAQHIEHEYLPRNELYTNNDSQRHVSSPAQHQRYEQIPYAKSGNGHSSVHRTSGREPIYESNGDSIRYYLHESNPVDDAPSVDTQAAYHLRSVGVQRVGDLLRVVPTDLATRLAHIGITSQQIRKWQAEALLVCRVPNLHLYDARILVACGVTDPELLRQTRPIELHERVTLLAKSADGQALLDSGSKFEIERLAKWIESSARHHVPVASKAAA